MSKAGWRSLPIAGIIPKAGSSLEYKTGTWRAFKPIVDESKCTFCLLCWIYCPDGAVKRIDNKRKISIDYDYCKGCGICASECPVKAISMVEE
jgi:pyruvate ferredoxin oxidoreductase delta subunit